MTTADQMAVRILLNPKLTEKQRQTQLAALKTKVSDFLQNKVPCPECEDEGPHEDNGARGYELAYLCTNCGAQWQPDSTEGPL